MTFPTHLKQPATLTLCVSLALLTAGTLFYSLWQWHSDWLFTHPVTASNATVATDTTTDMVAAIPNEHLFGNSFSGDVPITSLQLHVTGIVKVNNEQNDAVSKVYISIAGQPSKIYQVGDNLPYGVKIDDITAEAVILENDGRIEKLPLQREKLQFKPKDIE